MIFSHLAFFVVDLEESIQFYQDLFGMTILWRNDEKAYLTTGNGDNLGLLVGDKPPTVIDMKLGAIVESLETTPNFFHFGPVIQSKKEFSRVLTRAIAMGIEAVAPKRSRDGTLSTYFKDPSGYVVQVMLVADPAA